jgi:V/A-type H+/Na+-transporting ATPase subunit C
MMEIFEAFFNPSNPWFWVFIASTVGLIMGITARVFATYAKFVYPNAKFEAMGTPFVSEKKLNDLTSQNNLTSFIDSVNTNKDYNLSGENTLEVQNSIDKHFLKTVEMMRTDSSKKMKYFFDSYLSKYDYYLIKKVIKDKFRDKEIDEEILKRPIVEESKKLLIRLYNAKKEEIPKVLKNADFNPEIIDILEEEEVDFLLLDIALDKQLIEKLEQTKIPYKCKKAKQKMIHTLIDVFNVKNILRAKQRKYDIDYCKNLFLGEGQEIREWLFNEMAEQESVSQAITRLDGTSYYDYLKDKIEQYNKYNSVQVLENGVDQAFLNIIKDISTEHYVTIGPTIRFIVSKEYEVRNLKVLAKGVGEKISTDLIKRNLIIEVPR